jgi:hypothetical protein
MTKRVLITLAGAALLLLGLLGGSAQAFGISAFGGAITDPGGAPLYQAGAHPDLTTLINLPTVGPEGEKRIEANVKDIGIRLPAGLVGDPSAAKKCTQAQLVGGTGLGEGSYARCPTDAQVGISNISFTEQGSLNTVPVPVYNMEPPPGAAGEFAFNFATVLVFIDARLANNGGYRLEARVSNISQILPISGDELTLWGVPADPSHDSQRYDTSSAQPTVGIASTAPRVPFLTNPTACTNTPQTFHAEADSWQEPGVFHEASFDHDLNGNPLIVTGCERLPFEASLKAKPTTTEADSPSGLDVSISVPQNTNPLGLATSNVKDVSLVLPQGMTVDPSSANGLGACSAAQVNLEGEGAAACPESSKLGTVEIETPLLEDPLKGSVYLAQQRQNKFGSLLALYISVDDPVTGTVLKLPGKITADPATGRITASFTENPQVPFSALRVNLFGGPRAALRTPSACGTYTTQGSFAPWSGTAAVTSSDSFNITTGPNGSACPRGTFGPKLEAAAAKPLAGKYSPLGFRINRADGSPALSSVAVNLPKGLLAKLKGIPYCPDAAIAAVPTAEGTAAAQIANPSCPASSQVGTVTVGAGAGASPFYLHTGKAYLAGPYKGAPVSLAIITPALAGPFDLGNVVVRVALNVDPLTTQVTAVSDPIPTILDGIPLDIRSLVVEVDREGFTVNPTNCGAKEFTGTAASVLGTTSPLFAAFQVANCEGLGFAPKLALSLKGGTERSQDPALRAVLTAPAGEANIAKVQVILPKSEFIDTTHIGNVCTRPQFAARKCPANSVLGRAKAYSPLLAKPLTGKVYLRSNGGERELPDIVADLRGQFHVVLVGFVDSVKTKGSEISRVRNTFAKVPDVPVSKFELALAGDKRGLLENSADLCEVPNRAQVTMRGQNGKSEKGALQIKTDCGGGKGGKGAGK